MVFQLVLLLLITLKRVIKIARRGSGALDRCESSRLLSVGDYFRSVRDDIIYRNYCKFLKNLSFHSLHQYSHDIGVS